MTLEQYLMKVQAITKIGLLYSTCPYDRQQYEELEKLTQTMIETMTDQTLSENWYQESRYPTPSVSVRVLLFNQQGEVLMVKEKTEKLWSFPGGWCDVFETARENAWRECYEETGYDVEIMNLLGVFSRDLYKVKERQVSEYVLYFAGNLKQQLTQPNHEIEEIGFFKVDHLPPLSFKNSSIEVQRALACYFDKRVEFD